MFIFSTKGKGLVLVNLASAKLNSSVEAFSGVADKLKSSDKTIIIGESKSFKINHACLSEDLNPNSVK